MEKTTAVNNMAGTPHKPAKKKWQTPEVILLDSDTEIEVKHPNKQVFEATGHSSNGLFFKNGQTSGDATTFAASFMTADNE